jgi:alpha-glucosidase
VLGPRRARSRAAAGVSEPVPAGASTDGAEASSTLAAAPTSGPVEPAPGETDLIAREDPAPGETEPAAADGATPSTTEPAASDGTGPFASSTTETPPGTTDQPEPAPPADPTDPPDTPDQPRTRRRRWRAGIAALVAAALLAGAGLAGLLAYPKLRLMRDAVDLTPGLQQVDHGARGLVGLGEGVYVNYQNDGLRITRWNRLVWRSVDRGSAVTAGLGQLQWRGAQAKGGVLRARELVDQALGNLRIEQREYHGSFVRYTGRIFAGDPHGPDSRPLVITVTRRAADGRVLLDVEVPGAAVVTIHEFRYAGYTYRGLGEQLAPAVLRGGRWPIVTRSPGTGRGALPLTWYEDLAPGGDIGGDARGGDLATTSAPMPFYLASTMTGVALDTTAYSVVDLSHGGRVDVSVWAPRMRARLYDGDDPEYLVAAHSADTGRMRPPPAWATSGAIVGVRGSSARIRGAVATLDDAGAHVAAVLVRDGGNRTRYPDWDALVAELRERGVRTMAAASPTITEPSLRARAESLGYLVHHDDGRGTDLVDLTNAQAFSWYAGVLAASMREDGLSGWLAEGGDDLPMDARLAAGNASDAHNSWPTRWAQLTRLACQRAGVPDCLVLQDSAAEQTPQFAGVFDQGRQVTDWSEHDGLASVLRGKLSAGLSGMAMVSSGVGGWSSPNVRAWPDPKRTDELLARWAELEAFGSVLRTEDGDAPGSMPQVWDSPSRTAAFAHATQLFAATADYRRQVMETAARTGLPVVRPFWIEYPDARQSATSDEFFFGDSLLVVPVLQPGQRQVQAVLPAGDWIELFTGRTYSGPTPYPTPTPSAAGDQREKPGSGKGAGPDDEVDQGVQPPPPPGGGPDETPPPAPITVTIPAPLGQPVVLFRQGDPQGEALRAALLKVPHLATR